MRVASRPFAILLVLLMSALVLGACGGAQKRGDDALTGARPAGGMLAFIPADTPYVLASLEPMPWEVVEPVLTRATASFDAALEAMPGEGIPASTDGGRLAQSLLQELRGNVSRQGLEAMGLTVTPQFALYGVGVLPVYRMQLGDPEAFEAMMQRVEARAGVNLARRTTGKITWRAMVMPTEGEVTWLTEDGEQLDLPGQTPDPWLVMLAIVGPDLVVGVMPESLVDTVAPHMLGITPPAQPMSSANALAAVQKAYGFKPFGVGLVDVERIFAMLTGKPSAGPLNVAIAERLSLVNRALSPVCDLEIGRMVAAAPRAVFGYEQVSRSSMDTLFAIEIKDRWAADLAEAGAPIPGLDAQRELNPMMLLGLGLDMGRAMDVSREVAQRVLDDPFQCPLLTGFNDSARRYIQTVAMAPPNMRELRGLSLSVRNASMAEPSETAPMAFNLEAMALLAAQNPATWWNMMAFFASPASGADLKADGVPMALSFDLEQLPGLSPHAAMNEALLALSVGTGFEKQMADVMAQPQLAPTPLFVLSVDYARTMALVGTAMASSFGADAGILDMWSGGLGNVVMSADVDRKGVYLRYRVTYSPEQP